MSDPDRTPDQWAVASIGPRALFVVVLGCAAALAGAIAGLVLALHRFVIQCPDGTVIDDGADPNCYAYPDVAQGLSMMFASLALVALILLAARVLYVVQARQPFAQQSTTDDSPVPSTPLS